MYSTSSCDWSQRLLLHVALVCCLLWATPSVSYAVGEQQLNLAIARLINNATGLNLQVGCSVADEDTLRDLLKDGATIELFMTVELEGHRSWWSDSTLFEAHFSSILKHNPLTREFTATDPAHQTEIILREKNLTRLLYQHWRQFTLPLLSTTQVSDLDPKREYSLRLTLGLRHVEVPPWLEKSTLFWSPEVAPSVVSETTFTLPVLPAQ